ncbi:MAG: nucleoside deaminase [Candidatus Obscuribacterales bacterium]|nr:nucleoside deaminase [Candidatus Obscuribacterales bacterium]
MRKVAENAKLVVGLLATYFSITSSYAEPVSVDVINAANKEAKTIVASDKVNDLNHEQIVHGLRAANEVAKEWKKFGHHPFGAVLLAPDNEQILMRQGNLSVVRHAETDLARRAAETYSPEYLSKCTLVTTMEPCAMCAGAIYWANIGRVLYGATESTLGKLTGTSTMNPTMNLPCKKVFDSGQKSIQLIGPIPEMEEELIEPHKGFWK